MIDQSETEIRIERPVNVAADRVFAVLVDPSRHAEIDGSGMVRGVKAAGLITAVGQVFTMEMTAPGLGDYATDNYVVEFEAGRLLTWATTREGRTPTGFRWGWIVEPLGPERSMVVHSYDWSGVSDERVLAQVNFPRVSAKAMNETVTRLAAAAAQ